MRIFLARATGAVGKPLIRLLAAGHEAGTEPVVADGLDKDAVARAVRRTAPEVVVHELTALSHLGTNMRKPRPHLRAHEPAAHRGHREPAHGRARGRRSAPCGAELRRLAYAREGGP